MYYFWGWKKKMFVLYCFISSISFCVLFGKFWYFLWRCLGSLLAFLFWLAACSEKTKNKTKKIEKKNRLILWIPVMKFAVVELFFGSLFAFLLSVYSFHLPSSFCILLKKFIVPTIQLDSFSLRCCIWKKSRKVMMSFFFYTSIYVINIPLHSCTVSLHFFILYFISFY